MPVAIILRAKMFWKAQASAFIAGIVDFGGLAILVEYFHVYYAAAVAIAAGMGAVTNFFINRYWAFQAHTHPMGGQAGRYLMVSAGSLLLNTVLVYWCTEKLGTQYMVSKLIVATAVAVFYNYPIHKFYVYAKRAEVAT